MGQIQIMALLTMATEFCMQGEVERGGRRGGGVEETSILCFARNLS